MSNEIISAALEARPVAAGETVDTPEFEELANKWFGSRFVSTAERNVAWNDLVAHIDAYARAHAAREVAAALEGQAKPTDLSKRLRGAKGAVMMMDYRDDLLTKAADEIERYYGGMLAWKQTAETKNRKLGEEITGRVNDRIAARLAAPQQQAQAVAVPQGWRIRQDPDGVIVVQNDTVGGYAARRDADSIASAILHALAADILAATPAAPGSEAVAAGCDCDDGMVWNEGCTQPCEKCQDITDDSADEGQARAAQAGLIPGGLRALADLTGQPAMCGDQPVMPRAHAGLTDEQIYEHYKALNLPHAPVVWQAALGTVRAVLAAIGALAPHAAQRASEKGADHG